MIVAFVHAKGSSERLPGKNKKILGGIPLFCHAIQAAKAAELVDLVVIDSDDDEILRIGQEHGATPLKRPDHLANNQTTGDDLMEWQAGNYPGSEIVVQVVPTSPFIEPPSIDTAIMLIRSTGSDSAVGVRKEPLYVWRWGLPTYMRNGLILNSNELEPTTFETTGLYASRTGFVLKHGRRININSVQLCYLSKVESVDINTEEDFQFAEALMLGRR